MPLARTLTDRRLPGSARVVTVNLSESPLSWLRARGMLSERQFAAGEQLREDYERAALGPQVTMRWDASGVTRQRGGAASAPDPSANQLAARERFSGAIDHAGAGLSDMLWRTICAGETLPTVERALGWPARSGRVVLTLALDRIADYYRIG